MKNAEGSPCISEILYEKYMWKLFEAWGRSRLTVNSSQQPQQSKMIQPHWKIWELPIFYLFPDHIEDTALFPSFCWWWWKVSGWSDNKSYKGNMLYPNYFVTWLHFRCVYLVYLLDFLFITLVFTRIKFYLCFSSVQKVFTLSSLIIASIPPPIPIFPLHLSGTINDINLRLDFIFHVF